MAGMGAARRVVKPIGWAAGLLLMVAAGWYAQQAADWSAMRDVSPAVLTGLCGLVALNLWVTAALFWAVTLLYPVRRPIGLGTMSALIAVSALVNYVPVLRAGLWGRAAYLKLRYGLRVRDSGLSLVLVSLAAGSVLGVAAMAVGAARLMHVSGGWGWVGLVTGLAVLGVGLPWTMRRWPMPVEAAGRPWVWSWVPLRAVDLAAAAGRLMLAFAVVGVQLPVMEAVLMASASLIVKLVGLTPNGLGLAEGALAAMTAVLTPVEAGVGAAAAIIDRAAEMAVTLLAAVVGAGWLAWEQRRHAPTSQSMFEK